MEAVVWEVVFFVISVLSVLVGLLGLPGNFVPVLAALFAVIAGDGSFTWIWFIVFLSIAVSGEVFDQVTGVYGAKKYGATRPGMFGALIGGIVGGVVGTMILPVIGSLAGVFVGCFAFTFLFEYLFSERSTDESRKAGVGAVLGKTAAMAYKFIAGFVLIILMAWRFWGT